MDKTRHGNYCELSLQCPQRTQSICRLHWSLNQCFVICSFIGGGIQEWQRHMWPRSIPQEVTSCPGFMPWIHAIHATPYPGLKHFGSWENLKKVKPFPSVLYIDLPAWTFLYPEHYQGIEGISHLSWRESTATFLKLPELSKRNKSMLADWIRSSCLEQSFPQPSLPPHQGPLRLVQIKSPSISGRNIDCNAFHVAIVKPDT